MSPRHKVIDSVDHPKYERLKIQLRSKSRFYQACVFHDGRLKQKSTRVSSLEAAIKIGGEWYRKLLGSRPVHPRVAVDATCSEVYAAYKLTLADERRAYAEQKWRPIKEFWGTKEITEISGTTFLDFYVWRKRQKVKAHTLYKDVVLIRQVLKHAAVRGVITALPVIPKVGKIEPNPRPWLTIDEFNHLRSVSRKRIEEAKGNPRLHRQREDCHEFMMMMYHSNFRVSELRSLTFGECRFDKNEKGEDILISEIEGKTGFREVVTRATGAYIFSKRQDDRLEELQQNQSKVAREPVFRHKTRDSFRELLIEADLYVGKHKQTRNLKSIRCTAIAVQVLAEVNPLWIAKNAGTSLHMIDQYYVKRLTPLMAKNALTSFSAEKNPEMSVKFFVGQALPIPKTKAKARGTSTSATSPLPPALVEPPDFEPPTSEELRRFARDTQSASTPTWKELQAYRESQKKRRS